VEAPSQSLLDLTLANVFAASVKGVVVVSNSWGYPNDDPALLGEPFVYDGFFVTPTGHQDSNGQLGGVAFFASSGDTPILNYPSTSENVISVGGFTQGVDINGNPTSFAPWSLSGGGQDTNYVGQYHVPLVALDADPNTGVFIFTSTDDGNGTGWQVVGGTSLACPAFAAYTSIIDQGLEAEGGISMDTRTLQNDILTANETSLASALQTFSTYYVPAYPLGTAYPLWPMNIGGPTITVTPDNGNTGWGSPNGFGFTDYVLSGDSTASNGVTTQGANLDSLFFQFEPTTTPAAQAITPAVTLEAFTPGGAVDTSFNGLVTLTLGGSVSGATLNGTLTVVAVNGVATFSNLSIQQAGLYQLSATAPGVIPAESTSFTIGSAAEDSLTFVQEPTPAWQFGKIEPGIALAINDVFGNVDFSANSDVSVTILSGPTGAVLSGATMVAAVNGVATFTGLSINLPGTYTLRFTDGSLNAATSVAFQVVPIPVERHFLFNGIGLSQPAILQQQSRNAVEFTANGAPSAQEIAAAMATFDQVQQQPMFSNGFVEASAPVPAATFAAGTSLASHSTTSALLDSNSGINQLLDN
jgi:hypothetical protein